MAVDLRAAGPGLVHSSTSDPCDFSGADSRLKRIKGSARLVDRPLSRLKKMRHGILTAARLHGECCVRQGRRYRAAMVTLTYDTEGTTIAGGQDWRPRHLSEYLHAARQFCKRAGQTLRYAWVAEMQKRGVVHYHVMLWLPYVAGREFKLPKPDVSGWWPHGKSRIEWAQKAAGYLAKYTSKGQDVGDPPFPKGIRISGVGGLDPEGQREHRWWRAPSEAREALGPAADIRRVSGGRFDAFTGLFWESPWRLLLIEGKPHMILKGVSA